MRSSSRAATSRRSSARTPRGSTRSRTSPPATDTAGSVETIARGSDADEIEVARRGDRAGPQGRSSDGTASEPRDHVGFYLVDRGQAELKAAFGYRPAGASGSSLGAGPSGRGLLRRDRRAARASCDARPSPSGLGGAGRLVVAVLALAALLLPLSELAVGLVNHLLTLLLPPRVLPKLDFKDGIPAEHATFIVIPAMLARASSAAALAARLETHYLANPDPSLRFALLTDFADASQRDHAPGRRADRRCPGAHPRP